MKIWYLLNVFIFRKCGKDGFYDKDVETTAFIIQQNQRTERKNWDEIHVLKLRICPLKIGFGENLCILFFKVNYYNCHFLIIVVNTKSITRKIIPVPYKGNLNQWCLHWSYSENWMISTSFSNLLPLVSHIHF